MSHDIIRLQQVTVGYGKHDVLVGVSASIACGSLVALAGPNGAGKSTLLRAILGWHPLKHGEIRIGDKHAHHSLPRLAYLPQRPEVDWDFPITVRQVVAQGRWPLRGLFGTLTSDDKSLVDRALDELGIGGLAEMQIRRLSGGEQQRMFLARALAQGADIFLLDEPFNNLDIHAQKELLHILENWHRQGRTVIAALHDLALARLHFSDALLLNKELIAYGSAVDVLRPENIDRAYRPQRCAHERTDVHAHHHD